MEKPTKIKVYEAMFGIGILFSAWFIWYSVGLYQDKIEAKAHIEVSDSYHITSSMNQSVIEYQGKTYEKNPSVKAILFMGVDTAGEMEQKVTGDGGQADAVFLVAYDAAKGKIRILMIPRDTMTPITLTDLSGNVLGKDIQHLTLAYAYGDGKELSCQRMSEAVSELLGDLPIDGYLSMNTNMISRLNDLAGGVTVTIDVDGMERRDAALTKGSKVTLQGAQAEIYVRYRDIEIDHSAITRMSQQKQYIEAYLEAVKIQAAKDDQTIVRIMNEIEGHMITNMNKPQYMEMAATVMKSSQTLTEDDILVLPGEAVVTERFDEYHHDPEGTKNMVLDLFYREK